MKDSALNGGGVLDETGKEIEGGGGDGSDTQTALGVATGVSGGGSKTRRNKSAKNKRNKRNKSAKNKSAKNKRNKNAKNKRNKSSNKRKKSGKR